MKSKRISGFTLVELLVVIGIIALLISILLPALNSARRQAQAIKCEAALREIGRAMNMYVSENNGWACPAKANYAAGSTLGYCVTYPWKLTSGGNTWPNGFTTYEVQYWYNFLAKYACRGVPGSINGTISVVKPGAPLPPASLPIPSVTMPDDLLAASRNTVFWGCPAWQGFQSNASFSAGGLVTSQPGYGFNGSPEYRGNNPPPKDPNNFVTQYPTLHGYPGGAAIATPVAGGSTGKDWGDWRKGAKAGTSGTWYKWNEYTQASERALAADNLFWIMECDAAYLNPASVPNAAQYKDGCAAESAAYNQYTSTIAKGQSYFDFYRHGTYPTAVNGIGNSNSYYDPHGGKIKYNVLFCDGHVATLTDMPSGYKAFRMRFPG